MNELERITNATLEQLKAGYAETDEHYTCICCGESFEKGVIYPADDRLYEAGRYIRRHIEQEHGSVFAFLAGLDKSAHGLSDLQRDLLLLFFQGKSDADVQRELGIGSPSTVRNHRFLLREKERQAKVFLALMELLRANDRRPAGPSEKVVQKYFSQGTAGPLRSIPASEPHQRIVLGLVADRIEGGRMYSEAEINALLEPVFADYVKLRRCLVDLGLLKRLPDGSQYWRDDAATEGARENMDRKRELKRQARETRVEAGVYRIVNTRNGKSFVESTRNLKTINGQRFTLENDSHMNRALQQEWNEFGADAFTFEVLEVLERPETGYFDETDALKKLKEKWLDQLQPFGERGYNPMPK